MRLDLGLFSFAGSIAALEKRYELLLQISENNALSAAAQIKNLLMISQRFLLRREALKSVEELKRQLSVRAAALEKERKERDARAERVKALEGELAEEGRA